MSSRVMLENGTWISTDSRPAYEEPDADEMILAALYGDGEEDVADIWDDDLDIDWRAELEARKEEELSPSPAWRGLVLAIRVDAATDPLLAAKRWMARDHACLRGAGQVSLRDMDGQEITVEQSTHEGMFMLCAEVPQRSTECRLTKMRQLLGMVANIPNAAVWDEDEDSFYRYDGKIFEVLPKGL